MWTLEYAGFSDNSVHVDGDSWQLGGSRLIGERWVAGFGVLAQTRDAPEITPTGRRQNSQDGVTGFLEFGWQF